MSTVHIRISDETKKAIQEIFEKLGLDMSSAVKLYFHQVLLQKGIPFPITTINGLTFGQEDEILEAVEDAEKGRNVSKSMNPAAALAYLKKL